MKYVINIALLIFSQSLLSEELSPPIPYIDNGACPFECCEYGNWMVDKTITIYKEPDTNSKEMGQYKKGDNINAVTGFTNTEKPGKAVVIKPHKSEANNISYSTGDVLWVYRYMGEGFNKVWYKGEMYEEEILYDCDINEDYCWLDMEEEDQTTWWVMIKDTDGNIVWANETENLSNNDACS